MTNLAYIAHWHRGGLGFALLIAVIVLIAVLLVRGGGSGSSGS